MITPPDQAKADRYAVFGNPIKHSKSPQIHKAFATQFGHTIGYTKQEVGTAHFKAACDEFFNSGGLGLNVTLPFKQEACAYAEKLSERALLAKAVNTLSIKDGLIHGDNTDGAGLIIDVSKRLQWPITNKRVLILGAGGAVRGVLKPLLDHQPSIVVIANRTVEKALDLAREFSPYGAVSGLRFGDVRGCFDLIINGTSASLSGELPAVDPSVFSLQSHAYDMAYGEGDTVFIEWAKSNGVTKLSDGLGMLVGQAAESFFIWRGVRPDIKPVIAELKAS